MTSITVSVLNVIGLFFQHPGMAGGYQQGYGTPNMPPYSAVPPHVDVCQIVVPDKAVGAIIGAGGSMIKQIMEDSNAYVTVCAIYSILL